MVKGQQKFILANRTMIDGIEYVRCGRVNQFIRSFGIVDPPKIYAMKLHEGHHYMQVRTFESLIKSLKSKYPI